MILDIILILLFLVVGFIGYKSGFLTTLLKLASGISGLIIALCLTQPVTNLAVNNGWNDSIEAKIYNNISTSEAFNAYIEGGKGVEGLSSLLKELGIPSFMSGFVAEEIASNVDPQVIATSVSESVARMITLIIVFVALLVLSSVIFFILKLFVNSLKGSSKIIGIADGILGVIFYVIVFIVVLYIVFFILSLIMKGASADSGLLTFMTEQLHLEDDKFGLAKYIYENNVIVLS